MVKTQQELEPITPEHTKEMYLNARKREVSQGTLGGYHVRLSTSFAGAA